jgi:ankyrin repeat protein
VLAIARLLLDDGADPNDFYMAGDAQYSVLTGIAGDGEQDSPRQPYASELFDLLLERGAEPFDIQVLYDTHFSGDMLWWLELVYKRTIGTPRSVAWADPDWPMLDMGGYGSGARFVLETAIKKRDLKLAEWALTHGANPNAGHARDRRFPQRSLYEFAVLEQQDEIAELLLRHGARLTTPSLDDRERFVDTVMRLDRDAARASLRQHPEYLQSPFAMFEAARRDRPDALALLLELGFSPDIQDTTGKRALHEAAANDAVRAIAFLIERGAEVDPRETMYGGAPIGWAGHGDKRAAMDLLSRHSRNIWTLCFHGYVDRIREILAENPALARQVDNEGCTPLWWLPDEEEKAMTIVELLLAAGADPSVRNEGGRTAGDWARRRGMTAIAERLQSATAARQT